MRDLTAEKKQYKAKVLRYKRPIARDMNLDYIRQAVWDMQDVIQDVQWFCDEDKESLVNAMAGDEDDAWQFQLAFIDLATELERFQEDLNTEYVSDCFDDLFPAAGADYFGGFLGYDAYENDYYGLMPFEYKYAHEEAEKRILRLTKKELLDAVGSCLKVYSSYVALQYRYDCLEASLEIIRGQNLDRLKMVKAIEELYEKAEEGTDHFRRNYGDGLDEYERMLWNVPTDFWL